MRRAFSIAMALTMAGLQAAPAQAEDSKEEKWVTTAVADKPAVTINPAKAYILVHSVNAASPMFVRVPTAEEAAGHAAMRSEALVKEHKKWVGRLAQYEATVKTYAKLPKSSSVSMPERPVEPTEANFQWPSFEQTHTAELGPMWRFAKVNGSAYLQEVPPGRYIYYGNIYMGAGVCACLGTVAFDAPAGKIMTMRYTSPFLEAWQSAPKDQRPKTAFDLPKGITPMKLEPAAWSDPRLPADALMVPTFTPVARMANWFGIEIDRIMPLEGLFHYERDVQVNDATPAPVSSVPSQG